MADEASPGGLPGREVVATSSILPYRSELPKAAIRALPRADQASRSNKADRLLFLQQPSSSGCRRIIRLAITTT